MQNSGGSYPLTQEQVAALQAQDGLMHNRWGATSRNFGAVPCPWGERVEARGEHWSNALLRAGIKCCKTVILLPVGLLLIALGFAVYVLVVMPD